MNDDRRVRRSIEEAGYLKCPECGGLNWSVTVKEMEGVEFGYCSLCGRESPINEYELVEREELAFECPKCGMKVTDTSENWSWGSWGGPEPVIVCPKCLIPLRGYIHHENPNGPSIIVETEEKGGHQLVFHKNCPEHDESPPVMELKRICVDALPGDIRSERGASRIVLIFQCSECGEQQVIKHTLLDTRIWDAGKQVWWEHPKLESENES